MKADRIAGVTMISGTKEDEIKNFSRETVMKEMIAVVTGMIAMTVTIVATAMIVVEEINIIRRTGSNNY